MDLLQGIGQIKKIQVQRLTIIWMNMIKWMCGHTKLERSNGMIREKVGMEQT